MLTRIRAVSHSNETQQTSQLISSQICIYVDQDGGEEIADSKADRRHKGLYQTWTTIIVRYRLSIDVAYGDGRETS